MFHRFDETYPHACVIEGAGVLLFAGRSRDTKVVGGHVIDSGGKMKTSTDGSRPCTKQLEEWRNMHE